jgi:hypothetical protein
MPFLVYVLTASVIIKYLMKSEMRKAETVINGLLFVYPAIMVLVTVL